MLLSPQARVRFPFLLLFSSSLLILLAILPAEAQAQISASRLDDEECLVGTFIAFEEVVMTSVATHVSGSGDVYQAICDDEDCWGFSINRDAGVNVLTTGLTVGEYDWFVCAWNGSVKKVVGNLTGGPALFSSRLAGNGSAMRRLNINDARVPEGIRRFARRLDRTARQ